MKDIRLLTLVVILIGTVSFANSSNKKFAIDIVQTGENVTIPTVLEKASYLTRQQLKEIYLSKKVDAKIKERAQAMYDALGSINNLQKVNNKVASKLSSSQQSVVRLYNKALDDDMYKKILQDARKRNELQSFSQVNAFVRGFCF